MLLKEYHDPRVDIYRVLEAFNVTCPALQHSIKKQLLAGGRGHKDKLKDLRESLASTEQAIEMEVQRDEYKTDG